MELNGRTAVVTGAASGIGRDGWQRGSAASPRELLNGGVFPGLNAT
jgi:NADP-dependent 3-hydroxy acid dehydrogenase YdfG